MDRLTEANYVDIHSYNYSSHGWTQQYKTDNKYQEKVSYDLRGNITALERNGLTSNCQTYNGFIAGLWGKIDNLTYNYDPADLNKLIKVTDAADLTRGFKSVNNNTTYTYDANGNLTSDLNKNITGITYNYLNLPLVISFTGNNRIEFIYDATGSKLRKTTYVNNVLQSQDVRDYVNGVEYKGGVVDRFAHTEGAVVRQADGTTFLHEYTIKDHLGNARVTYSDANSDGIITVADIKQINHYYPFGMNMEGNWNGAAGSNKYQYNEKEWNDDFGLGWNDYGARFYDASIGRFNSGDELSFLAPDWSPYRYAFNNPMLYIDPDGLFETKKEASIYQKDHDLQGKIVQQKDGTYAIENKEASTSISNNKEFGIETAALVTASPLVKQVSALSTSTMVSPTAGTIRSYEPNVLEKIKESGVIGGFAINFVDPLYITFQHFNPFDNQRTDLSGNFVNANEKDLALANALSTFIPIGRGAQAVKTVVPKGLEFFSKYSAAQFSKLAKGTWIASLKPAARGRLNKILNFGIEKINNSTSSGNAVISGAKSVGNTDKKE